MTSVNRSIRGRVRSWRPCQMMSIRQLADSLPRFRSCSLPQTADKSHCAQISLCRDFTVHRTQDENLLRTNKGFVILFTQSRVDLRDCSGLAAEQLTDFLVGCISSTRDA